MAAETSFPSCKPPTLGRRGLLTACAVAFGGLFVPPLARLAAAQTAAGGGRGQNLFRIATGGTGGTYYPIGVIIANALSNPPGTRPCDKGGSCGVPGMIATAQATSGSVDNLGLLASGAVEAAMTQADVAWQAYSGAGVFAGKPPFESLRTIGSLYVETIHVVARSDFRRIEDLKGLRVSLGEEGSGTLAEARAVLAAYGMKEGDLKPAYLKPATAADRMASGELDAFFMVGGHPVQAISELATQMPIALLPLSDAVRAKLRADHRFLSEATIPAGVYPGVDVVATVGVGAELMVRADRDPAQVYQVTRTLWHDRTKALLTEGHPKGAGIIVENAVSSVSVPLHPGAERYYREIGMMGDPPTP